MFFIYDANDAVFGNPNGYKTHSIAAMITTRYRYKLWEIYETRKDETKNVLFSITTNPNTTL